MSNLQENSEKNLKKTTKNSKFSLIFIIFFILLFFLLIINVSDIFSSLITSKNNIFSIKKIEIPSYSVYAVSINDFNSYEKAKDYSVAVKQKGGAGVVYNSGEYFVFISSYPSLSEAKEIKQNLLDLGYKSRIVNLKVDAVLTNYKGDNSSLFLSAINFFRKTYNCLQNHVINFDKLELTQSQVNSALAKLLSENISILNTMQNLKHSQDLPLKQLVFVPLTEVKKNLETLLCFTGEDMEYTSNLKQTCIEIILKNKQLVNQIKAL